MKIGIREQIQDYLVNLTMVMRLGQLWRGLEYTEDETLSGGGDEGTDPRWASGVISPSPTIFLVLTSEERAESPRTAQNMDASRICVPSLCRGHGNLLQYLSNFGICAVEVSTNVSLLT